VTIRNKVTLWYGVVLLLSLFITAGAGYYEFVFERNARRLAHKPEEPMEEEAGEILVRFIIPAMAVTVFGGWWLLRRSLRPLDQLTTAAERINAQSLCDPLPRTGNGDEVDRLSEVLNAMNQRISLAMNEIHKFMLHASHELKTPLTILHSEIETGLDHATTAAERNRLGSQLDEIQRLTRIVEDLALLARSNSGQMKFSEERVAFHEVVRDAAEDAAVLARSKNVRVDLRKLDQAWVQGDQNRLRQMLLNIVDNASKYNKREGSIVISVEASEAAVLAEVANTGEGIREEDLPNIFKTFYRGTFPPGHDPGGIGLGLSIAQCIAIAHHGRISVSQQPLGWVTVSIFLPKLPL
jgi:signal transduction histidine kinase